MDASAIIALTAVVVTPTLTFIYAVRHDRASWLRDTRWQVYLDLLEWGERRYRSFASLRDQDPAAVHGMQGEGNEDESIPAAKALAGASQPVLKTFFTFVDATTDRPRAAVPEDEAQRAADAAWRNFVRAIRLELGVSPRLDKSTVRSIVDRLFFVSGRGKAKRFADEVEAEGPGATSAVESNREP
ncbi:hypothetical protein GCM10027059_45680 [Myceligenerans halotolerans]